jgi:hypothetical protein
MCKGAGQGELVLSCSLIVSSISAIWRLFGNTISFTFPVNTRLPGFVGRW